MTTAATGLTDAALDLVRRQSFLVLATRNADATIHAVPLIYLFDGERFLMATPPGTRKAVLYVRNFVSGRSARSKVRAPAPMSPEYAPSRVRSRRR